MKNNSEIWQDPQDARLIRELRQEIEDYRDFMEWLFDYNNDEGVDWMSQAEAWEMFQKAYDKKYNSDKGDEPSVATEAK